MLLGLEADSTTNVGRGAQNLLVGFADEMEVNPVPMLLDSDDRGPKSAAGTDRR